jgi:hypothetical protein
MKFVSIIRTKDGVYAGVSVSEGLRPAAWRAKIIRANGGVEELAAESVGAMETDPDLAPVHERAAAWYETNGDAAPPPGLIPFPCLRGELPAFMRAKGLGHVPPRLRAWIALRDPDLASAHGLDQGVSLVSMRAAEQRGEPPVHAAQSRLAELDRRIAEDVTKRRRAVFEAREQRLQTTAAADSAWQEMISAIQANAPEGGV